jgi:hypothetical protein
MLRSCHHSHALHTHTHTHALTLLVLVLLHRRAEIADLRRKFDLDKQKIKEMRAARKFKPS